MYNIFYFFLEYDVALISLCYDLGQINLPLNASWDQYGVTVAGWSNGTNGSSYNQLNQPSGISITNDGVLYVADSLNHRIIVIALNSTNNISIIGSGPGSNANQFNQPIDLVAINTSLYVLDLNNHRMQKMSLNGSNPSTVPGLSSLDLPYFLYVDKYDNIYLSDTHKHRVLFYPVNFTNYTIVAGNGTAGSNNNQLNTPLSVFVNQNGTIYVADYLNHRIMKWFFGASSGIMVAGNGTSGSSLSQLSEPREVVVDINEYMYITDGINARIIRWGPNSTFGVCIAGCTGTTGLASNQLAFARSLSFDSDGSLYVSDRDNHRVQKFQILRYYSKH